MSNVIVSAVRRSLAVAFVVGLGFAPCGFAGAASKPTQDATAKICEVATECPTIDAVAKITTSARDITRFLEQLWSANFEGGLNGTYQLQRCGNPGPAPFHVDCVLFSTGTPSDLAALKSVFYFSRLFQSVVAVG